MVYLCIGYCEFRIVVSTIGRFQFYFIFVSILGDVNCFNDVAAGPSRWSYRLEKCAYNQCSSRINPYSLGNGGVFTRIWVSSIYIYSYLDIKTCGEIFDLIIIIIRLFAVIIGITKVVHYHIIWT